jgi:hypothetical protein
VRLRLSLGASIYGETPLVAADHELSAWASALQPVSYAAKDQAPIFSAAEFAPGQKRLKDHLRALHALVLDLDHVPLLDWRRVTAPLLQGLATIVYSSWSHAAEYVDGRVCLRVILPLSRPCEPDEWEALWIAAATRVGGGIRQPVTEPRGPVDPKCKDPAHVYYCPAYPAGAESSVWFGVTDGAPLDVDGLLAAGPGGDQPTTVVLDEIAARYSRRRTDAARDLGGRLRLLARGQSYAGPGERDDATWRIACALARELPDVSEHVLVATLEPSLAAMRAESPGDGADSGRAADKVRRAIEAAREDADRRDDVETARARALLRAAGRERCYEPAEISALMRAAGARDAIDLERRWVIQDDGNFYLLEVGRNGRPGYAGPFTTKSLGLAAEVRLAAAESAGVVTWTESAGKRKALAGTEIAQRYGVVAERVVVDIAAQQSSFDGRVLTRAPCPRRAIEPRRSEVVENWLAALAGEALPRVLDWLAVVTDLRRECAALYLHGKTGAGKGLLAAGLARIWIKGGPPDLDDVLPGGSSGGWNNRLLDCPLVFADERVPKDIRGHVRTDDLRKFISDRYRTKKVKFESDGEIQGAARVIIAANNPTLLQAGANLTQEDIEAIAERLLYVEVSEAGKHYLESLPRERIEAFVQEDEIAAHVLWLAETRVVERQGRFLVSGNRDKVVRSMTVSGGLRSAILNWVVLWLLEPNKLAGRDLVRVYAKEVLVSGRGVQEYWATYEVNYRNPPNAADIRTALSGICRPGTRQLRSKTAGKVRYWIVDQELIASWCDQHAGYAEWEDLQERIKTASETADAPGPWGGLTTGGAAHP